MTRLAGYDKNGDEIYDTDVLSDEELAMDAGLIPRRPAPEMPTQEETKSTVDLLAALQRSVDEAKKARGD